MLGQVFDEHPVGTILFLLTVFIVVAAIVLVVVNDVANLFEAYP